MDVRRISLIAGLAIVSYLMILQWSEDYSHTDTSVADTVIASEFESGDGDVIPSGNPDSITQSPAEQGSQVSGEKVQVFTDTFNVIIDLKGGDVVYAALPQYPLSLDTPDIPFQILENDARTYIAQSGLVGSHGVDKKGRAEYRASSLKYELAEGEETLDVVLSHTAESGLSVQKTFTFTRGSYLIDMRYDLVNNGNETMRTNLFGQLRRDKSADPSSGGGIGMRSYLGATFSTDNSTYEKVKFGKLDDKKFSAQATGGWVAMLQHYFLSAWVPTADQSNAFYGQKGKTGDYYVGFQAPSVVMGPGESASTSASLYIGPKDQEALREIAANLEKTVDYGWLWWVAQPIFYLLTLIQSLVVNWGWSIIVLTLLIKTALYPLTASSYRSMAKMRKFAPKIQDLREQFGDDRQRMSQEMMKLYQKEKLNPLGGCLPMLLQMPIFIALYWVLMESVELRQSPFMFWITDLSLKDPLFILPLLMGASMFLQMRMQQQPTMDPMQAKIMQFMPVMFTFMFLWFPAGLTLYWFVNNVITITQQFIVNKAIDREEAKKA